MSGRQRATAIVHKALAVVRPQFRLHLRHGIHGLPHWSRVWYHGRQLASEEGVDPAILAWFAFLHDSQRHDDGRDAGHGARAADFAVADRLDLWRVGIPPDPRRMCTERARQSGVLARANRMAAGRSG